MPRKIRDGAFYEFNRPDTHYEVGREIHRSYALKDVGFGRDVYTPRGSDAKQLAKDIVPLSPTWHPAQTRKFYPHYHPEGKGFGHIFYGQPGEFFEPRS